VLLQLQRVFTELHKKHDLLTKNVTLISDTEKAQILKDKTKFEQEWRKRKRISNDILNAILENYPKNKKTLFEEIVIETDEDVGASIPPAH
jgi:26S proteasome regulatory subunit (ATPase 3-interacting protein)